jgi:hypothetical protein
MWPFALDVQHPIGKDYNGDAGEDIFVDEEPVYG